MITAKFGSKTFEVSNKKIYTPNGLTFGEELNIEETAVSGKKPTTSIKGIKLESLSMEVKLDARFVDVLTEIKFWKKTLLAKKAYDFSLGKYTIGKFYLTKYEAKDITINKSGVYTSAVISLSFTEYTETTKATSSSGATAKKTTTTTTTTSIKNKAATATHAKPKSNTRWYSVASNAYAKKGTSGPAQPNRYKIVKRWYSGGKVACVNLAYKGWMRVEDVTFSGQTTNNGRNLTK